MTLANSPTDAELSNSRWERGYEKALAWMPYVTLSISTILSLTAQGPWRERAITLGLAAVAAAWVFVVYTITASRRRKQSWLRLYFVGLIVITAVLMIRNPIFFAFVITGFFHASLLRPWPVTFAGVAAASIVVNSPIVLYPNPEAEAITFFVIVVVIQTLAIGLGILGSEKLASLSEQRRVAVGQLEAALRENAGLHAQLVSQAREAGTLDERQRMAREIHDTVAQGLTGVITQLEAANQIKGDSAEQQRHLDNAARLARESLGEARRSVQAILPIPLENGRLPEALADVANQWSALNEVRVQVTTTGAVQWLHPEVEVTLLRVAQEALANVAKHAGASRVVLTLSFMEDMVTLDVRDDGIGFSQMEKADNGGFGLTAMRQRVARLAGTVEIESEPGAGTAISVTVPAEVNGG